MPNPEDEYEVDDDYGDYDEWYDYDDEYDDEPIGCCDECQCNLYESDPIWSIGGMDLCDQCYFYATGGEPLEQDEECDE